MTCKAAWKHILPIEDNHLCNDCKGAFRHLDTCKKRGCASMRGAISYMKRKLQKPTARAKVPQGFTKGELDGATALARMVRMARAATKSH